MSTGRNPSRLAVAKATRGPASLKVTVTYQGLPCAALVPVIFK